MCRVAATLEITVRRAVPIASHLRVPSKRTVEERRDRLSTARRYGEIFPGIRPRRMLTSLANHDGEDTMALTRRNADRH